MENKNQQLLIDQTERKLTVFRPLKTVIVPSKGWIHTLRTALKMSMRQLGNRLSISAQSVKEMEEREVNGTISIKSLSDEADWITVRTILISFHLSSLRMACGVWLALLEYFRWLRVQHRAATLTFQLLSDTEFVIRCAALAFDWISSRTG